jgi:hypothetical protein
MSDCEGITVSGRACARPTLIGERFCISHEDQSIDAPLSLPGTCETCGDPVELRWAGLFPRWCDALGEPHRCAGVRA